MSIYHFRPYSQLMLQRAYRKKKKEAKHADLKKLKAEGVVPVTLESIVTETGMLELWCVAGDGRRWKLEFNVRERAAA